MISTGEERIIRLSSKGSLFTVNNGVTLILEKNITLRGRNNNDKSVVEIYEYGTLIMNKGSHITDNISSSNGGGVYIRNNGTFNLNGGKITANILSSDYSSGGGVYISGGIFNMNDGEISENMSSYSGGGVYITNNGTFTMNGGKIYSNTSSAQYYPDGGGVSIFKGIFIMNNGEIINNTSLTSSSTAYGGGVYVSSNGIFSMFGGSTFSKTGGGIIYGNGSNTIYRNLVRSNSGTIYDNSGHAVYATGGGSTKRMEITVGSEMDLYYNNDTFGGDWDY